jgi:hypothetical protein
MSGSGRKTTFLTLDEGNRAPSAYHVDQHSISIRARQEHKGGPTVTSEKMRVQAFTQTKQQARSVASVLQAHVKSTALSDPITGVEGPPTLDPATALRLQIADGLASPVAKYGFGHVEASREAIGRGNPHISGGTVSFAKPGSKLSDFDEVVAVTKKRNEVVGATKKRKKEDRKALDAPMTKKSKSLTPPIVDFTTDEMPPETHEFNEHALRMQTAFMQDLMTRKETDEI